MNYTMFYLFMGNIWLTAAFNAGDKAHWPVIFGAMWTCAGAIAAFHGA